MPKYITDEQCTAAHAAALKGIQEVFKAEDLSDLQKAELPGIIIALIAGMLLDVAVRFKKPGIEVGPLCAEMILTMAAANADTLSKVASNKDLWDALDPNATGIH